jgi:hypothetical protein
MFDHRSIRIRILGLIVAAALLLGYFAGSLPAEVCK